MNSQQYTSFKDQLVAAFREGEERMNGASKSAFHQIRRSALQTFETLGFPTIRHEEWKYSNVKAMVGQAYAFDNGTALTADELGTLQIPNLEGNILYFVNGHYRADLSQIVSPATHLQIRSFAEALQTDAETIGLHFSRYADFQDSAFTALNTAFAYDGVFIRVPDNKVVEEPVILRFITDVRTQNVAAQPRNLIVIGRNADVKIAESYRTIGDKAAFTNIVTEVVVAADARVEHYRVQNDSQQTNHICRTQVSQADNSHYYNATITLNGGFVRNDLNIVLNGEHCEAFMYGLYMPNGTQHIDNHTLVDHAMPNSYSNELYKGILNDKGTGVFNGKIYVRPDAQKTNAYQSCKNVVLSPEASMNTKPQLEIYADDVKCSHGTTTGKLNEEALFYLQSRGIPKEAARTLLLYAFAEEVVRNIKIKPIREYLEGVVAEKLAL
ncbi:FeS assembly protein SufD [Fibrella aestuarina BUZ 2]|uniref:FeS assembly protein SufD n=1 Tax=Fibrella aestuarina BUZ 2 TaxID=1166018 RepID=I0K8I2_9BACT|nr:Fe-S cluster assembly protein SufD [Fibrella aestuarina]CCH00435.1 FeS assembly protein SufD [Fibrella aestuarina BUZ 2]